jgi:hypothetical protein
MHAANIKPMQTRINRDTSLVIKSLEHLKNLKTGRILFIGLELTMHVLKSQIHLARQSLQSSLRIIYICTYICTYLWVAPSVCKCCYVTTGAHSYASFIVIFLLPALSIVIVNDIVHAR